MEEPNGLSPVNRVMQSDRIITGAIEPNYIIITLKEPLSPDDEWAMLDWCLANLRGKVGVRLVYTSDPMNQTQIVIFEHPEDVVIFRDQWLKKTA